MGEEFALVVTQGILVDCHRLFAFKFDALHHSLMRELSARIEVFEHQSAVHRSQSAPGGKMYKHRDILDPALQSTVSIDTEVVAYNLG